MKKFSILGRTDQILTSNGKTLDKVIGQNNGSSFSNCVMLLHDDENPLFSFGDSILNLQLRRVYEPIQLVFNADIEDLPSSTFFDIVVPAKDKDNIGNDYISLFRRAITLKSSRNPNINTIDVIADVVVNYDTLETPYASETVENVSVDLDTPSVTYTVTSEGTTLNVTFNIFTEDGADNIVKPASVTVSEDGTTLYVLAPFMSEPYEFVIAAAGTH